MKSQTFSQDMDTETYGFNKTKLALLEAAGHGESPKHPIQRVKYKITFYWK